MSCYYVVEITGDEALMTTIPELTRHLATEVTGVEAIVTTILEPTIHHAYGMGGMFHFYAAVPPFC
jgi:hypothetical protein